jgi:Na+-translocating ferredoxin:NAD+ oxidoreductase RnfC subunit
MNSDETILRVDATYHLIVQEGQTVTQGQRLCDGIEAEPDCICPVSGTVQTIRFDPEHHEFVISVRKLR